MSTFSIQISMFNLNILNFSYGHYLALILDGERQVVKVNDLK